jgi:hypothetical protein
MMNGSMPTKGGDVVVVHAQSAGSLHQVWIVLEDGQQLPSPLVTSTTVSGRQEAERQAREWAAGRTATVFVRDQDSGEWTTLATENVDGRT